MERDELEPRKRRNEALAALAKEDLSLLGFEELEERITALEAEIARIRNEMVKKRGSLSAAEALFKK
ncbi:MAG: DUF1192 domain-containing protein [Parvibaculum sp.]|uniref:DUF1192 domain-containing protein n=1 Tax=Parvibaculum sp. TaxID=2024848 RepID=UPI002722AAF7|nr:DUF1192 domain-containing protein [Parvibaculum sp.]MDO8839372.1 DUF1192 domain-containing protein [Parvibaculum sp.]